MPLKERMRYVETSARPCIWWWKCIKHGIHLMASLVLDAVLYMSIDSLRSDINLEEIMTSLSLLYVAHHRNGRNLGTACVFAGFP
jgi:hypothetical protein